jgi:hypothetical protein
MGIFLSRKMLSAAGRCEFKLGPWLAQFDILSIKSYSVQNISLSIKSVKKA